MLPPTSTTLHWTISASTVAALATGPRSDPSQGTARPTSRRRRRSRLFLAHGASRYFPPHRPQRLSSTLDEPRAHVLLGDSTRDDKIDSWFLDSGATHHMTRLREFFSELNTDMHGLVKFGDSSTVDIKGIDFLILTSVYYIPSLRNSIISLRQLVENGLCVEIDSGVLCIWDRRSHLLAKVVRGSNCLYVIYAKVAQLGTEAMVDRLRHTTSTSRELRGASSSSSTRMPSPVLGSPSMITIHPCSHSLFLEGE